jgi:YggT family protein
VAEFATLLDSILRPLVLAAATLAGVVAATHWAVHQRRIDPFGPWARTVRRLSDPLVQPLERRLLRFGRSPREAALWLFGFVIIGGILLVSVTRWLEALLFAVTAMQSAGPRAWVHFGLDLVFNLLMLAILVRVVSSWFGVSPFSRWMRPAFLLTNWLVEPLRRRLPPFGVLDLSPLVAYLILVLARELVLSLV